MSSYAVSILGNTYLPDLEYVVRILAAVLLGGLIGLERELRDKPAGFRTITLISLGACVFTILSEWAGGKDGEHTRIAAQVVSGIGFLGAGAILRDRASVMGLTTAASIWSAAAVGMACGFGNFGVAATGTVAVLVALLIFTWLEDRIGAFRDIQTYRVVTTNTADAVDRVNKLFQEYALSVKKCTWYEEDADLAIYVVAMGAKESHDQIRRWFAAAEEYKLR